MTSTHKMFAALGVLAAVAPSQTPSPQAIPAPLGEAIAGLQRQSSWAQDTTYAGRNPDKSQRGVYPVGNGQVFTYMGLGERANTMMGMTGPTYAHQSQRLPRGNFGELTMDLGERDLRAQRVRRVTGANFVVTEDRSADGLALRTLTFAAPSSTTITRVVQVHNATDATIGGLKLYARLSQTSERRGNNLVVRHGEYAAVFSLSAAIPEGDALVTELGDLPAGTSSEAVLTISTGEPSVIATDPSTNLAIQAARSTTAWWAEKLRGTPKMSTDSRRVLDLFRDWKVLMLTMRDARSGVVAPMVTRRGAMIRESNGPILTFLRYNMWDEARGVLDYFYKAIRHTKEVREHYPMDLDFSGLANGGDYSAIQVPDSDLASWVLLQHFWYFRATRDAQYIKERQPFLLHLLKEQRGDNANLMRFSGHENYMRSVLRLDIGAMPRNPLFVTHDPGQDRESYSLASSLLFLIGIQGYGEMLDGIDRLEDPDKWAKDVDTDDRPSSTWMPRSFKVMEAIEENFYVTKARFRIQDDLEEMLKISDDWTGFFAPAISPVNLRPHQEPFANLSLFPLWVGFTFPTGERSRHNLRNSLARLGRPKAAGGERANTLIGTTATVGHFTGDVPGMLLTALIERDGVDRGQAFEDLLKISEPACEWAVLYNPAGRPIASAANGDWPDRMSPNECGINLDAAIYALNGIRHVNVPQFDNKSIKLKLRLPKGATFLNMDNLKKDGRAFNVHVDEFMAPLSPAEIKQNDAQNIEKYKKDPEIDHRRFRFRMRLLSDNPPQGRYQVDADVSGTMFVRYLYKGRANGVSGDIDEREFWKKDANIFFLDDNPSTIPEHQTLKKTPLADLLVLTNRTQCAEILGTDKVTYVDTGLPFSGRDLVGLMLKDGEATHPRMLLDFGYDASDSRAFKQSKFWQHRSWKQALSDFQAGGGEILRTQFLESFEVDRAGTKASVQAPGGRLQIAGPGGATVRVRLQSDRARDDLVLRLGTSCGYTVSCNGQKLSANHSGQRPPIRDQDSILLDLRKGDNVLEIQLTSGGSKTMFARLTGMRGLPATGVR